MEEDSFQDKLFIKPLPNMKNVTNKKQIYKPIREVDLDVAQRYPISAGPLDSIVNVQDTNRQEEEDNKYLGHAQLNGAGNVIHHDYSGVISYPQQLPTEFGVNIKTISSAQNQRTNLIQADETQRGSVSSYHGNINVDNGNLNYMQTPELNQRNSTNFVTQGNAYQNTAEKIMNQQTPDQTSREQIQREYFGSINLPQDDLYLANMQTPDQTQRGNYNQFNGQVSGHNASTIDSIQTPEITGRETIEDQSFQGIYSGQSGNYLDNMQTPDYTLRQMTQFQGTGNVDGMNKSLNLTPNIDETQRGNLNNYEGNVFGKKHSLISNQILILHQGSS